MNILFSAMQADVSLKSSPKGKFAEGERVLCFHGPLIYEAKALKISVTKEKQIKYYIHYAGWSKNWDEWVPESRVLKYTEANLLRQEEVCKQHNLNAKNKKVSKTRKSEFGGDTRSATPSKELNTTTPNMAGAAAVNASSAAGVGGTPVIASSTPTSVSSSRKNKMPNTPQYKESSVSDASSGTKKDEPVRDDAGSNATKEQASNNSKLDDMPKKRLCSQASDRSVQSSSSSVAPLPPNTGSACASVGSPSRGSRDCVESEEAYINKVEVKIKIPEELKQCLTDDWEAVTRNQKLLEVPAKITVKQIVQDYLAAKKAAKSSNSNKDLTIGDIMEGILEYFNALLSPQLLYKFERAQCNQIMARYPNKPASELYGAFHLLRLFVRLGHMIAYSALGEEDLQIILVNIQDFLRFLAKNSANYFTMSSFTNVNPEYIRTMQWAE